jgi:hypothetical protein
MDNVQNCDSYINIPSSHTYRWSDDDDDDNLSEWSHVMVQYDPIDSVLSSIQFDVTVCATAYGDSTTLQDV